MSERQIKVSVGSPWAWWYAGAMFTIGLLLSGKADTSGFWSVITLFCMWPLYLGEVTRRLLGVDLTIRPPSAIIPS